MTKLKESPCCPEDNAAAAAKKGPLACSACGCTMRWSVLGKAVLDVALTKYFESLCDRDSRQHRFVSVRRIEGVPLHC